jgi:hypothetical protein
MFSSTPLQEEGASNHGRDRRSRGNAMGAVGMPRAGMGARVPHHLARSARQWQGEAVTTPTPFSVAPCLESLLSILELKAGQPVAELSLDSNLRPYERRFYYPVSGSLNIYILFFCFLQFAPSLKVILIFTCLLFIYRCSYYYYPNIKWVKLSMCLSKTP